MPVERVSYRTPVSGYFVPKNSKLGAIKFAGEKAPSSDSNRNTYLAFGGMTVLAMGTCAFWHHQNIKKYMPKGREVLKIFRAAGLKNAEEVFYSERQLAKLGRVENPQEVAGIIRGDISVLVKEKDKEARVVNFSPSENSTMVRLANSADEIVRRHKTTMEHVRTEDGFPPIPIREAYSIIYRQNEKSTGMVDVILLKKTDEAKSVLRQKYSLPWEDIPSIIRHSFIMGK